MINLPYDKIEKLRQLERLLDLPEIKQMLEEERFIDAIKQDPAEMVKSRVSFVDVLVSDIASMNSQLIQMRQNVYTLKSVVADMINAEDAKLLAMQSGSTYNGSSYSSSSPYSAVRSKLNSIY